jgi:hypothetical protein
MIAFRGLNEALEVKTLSDWCKRNGYTLKIFSYHEVDKAVKYTASLNISSHIEVWGYSRGAVSAYELCKLTSKKRYAKLHTIGTYHTVTSSFGKNRKRLVNVEEHKNYVESHQQSKGFKSNSINVSLGNVSHFEATKKALEIIDNAR